MAPAGRHVRLTLGLVLLAFTSTSTPTLAQQAVSLELLLAVDCSLSVDDREFGLQMRGIANALRQPEVLNLILARTGGVAVNLLQWAGTRGDRSDNGWRLLADREGVVRFADEVERTSRANLGYHTGIGNALRSAIDSIETNAFEGAEKKIDLSGDGRSNTGPEPSSVRAEASRLNISVNGLAILTDDAGLAEYYAADVMTGNDAFVETAADYDDFSRAMIRKLIRELSPKLTWRDDRHYAGKFSRDFVSYQSEMLVWQNSILPPVKSTR